MTSQQQIKKNRNSRVDLEGTPPAIFLNDGTAGNPANIPVDDNNGGWIIDFEQETKTARLTPYSIVTVNNNTSSDLNVFVNQRRQWQKIARAQTVLTIKDFPGIRSVRISKRDAGVTTTEGQVEVNVERAPLGDDEAVRREQRRPMLARALRNFIPGMGG